MARFGTFKFGAEKYGVESNSNNFWYLKVDWTDAGEFDGSNEAYGRLLDVDLDRGRQYFMRAAGDGFDQMPPGNVILTMDNYDGRFTPTNTASPLYGYLESGKHCEFGVQDGSAGTKNIQLTGIITDIRPISQGNWTLVKLHIYDGGKILQDETISIQAQEDITISDCVGLVLAAVNWPARWGSNLDTGIDTLPIWGTDGENALKVLHDLELKSAGRMWISRDGAFNFSTRRAADALADTWDGTKLIKGQFAEENQRESKFNIVELAVREREKYGFLATMISLDSAIKVRAGETVNHVFEYTYNDTQVPAIVVAGVLTANYEAWTNQDATGIEITDDIVITVSPYGWTAGIQIVNNGTMDGWLTSMSVFGYPYNLIYETKVIKQGAGYDTEPRRFKLDLPWMGDWLKANDIATLYLTALNQDQVFFDCGQEYRYDEQFGFDIGDKIRLNISAKNLDVTKRIARIRTLWKHETGQAVETFYRLEPFIDASDGWQFTTQIGTTSYFAV